MLTITHTHEAGTLIEGTTRGDGTADVLKKCHWRWGHSIGAWYLPMSRDRLPKTFEIGRTARALREAGFEVALEIDTSFRPTAEVEAAKAERQEARAEALAAKAERTGREADALHERVGRMADVIPMGQPMMAGHHSEGRDRRYRARIASTMDKAVAASVEHEALVARAITAAGTTDRRYRPITVANRIEELERTLRDRRRKLERATGAWVEHLTVVIASLEQDRDYWVEVRRQQIASGAATGFGRDTVRKGDRVKVRGTWREVVRVNAKTVSVQSDYSWTDTAPYAEIQALDRPEATA